MTRVHMLTALMETDQGIATLVFRTYGITAAKILSEVAIPIAANSSLSETQSVTFSMRFKIILALAGREAKRSKDYYVGTQHVLLALMRCEDLCQRAFCALGMSYDATGAMLTALAKQGDLID
jgi:ATP-dependent Clp protease ATP-binding subunit ClpC